MRKGGSDTGVCFNFSVATATGLAAFVLVSAFGYATVNPAAWDDLAAGAGLRPAAGLLGGLVRGVYGLLFRAGAPDQALGVVQSSGRVLAGLVAFFAYRVVLGFCGTWADRLLARRLGKAIVAAAGVTSALAFLCADPVWYAMQGLTGDGLQILLALVATRLLQLFARTERRRYALASLFVWSVLAADVPLGFLGVLATVVTAVVTCRRARGKGEATDLSNPLVRIVLYRGLTAVFFLGFFGTVAFECGEQVMGYLAAWMTFVVGLVSWKLLLLALIVVFAPAVITYILVSRSLNDEDFQPVGEMLTHVVIAVVAWFQLSGADGLKFTSWLGGCAPASALAWAALVFVIAQTLAWTVLVLGVSLCLKKPQAIADFRYADAAVTHEGRRMLVFMERFRRGLRPFAVAFPLLVLASAVPFRGDRTLDGMLAAIDACLAQTVDECAGLTRVFTDGKLDAGLELTALRRGTRLWAVSVLPGDDRAHGLRNRGLVRTDDLAASERGALNLLRTWVTDAPERLADAAVQLAFELWRDRPEKPTYLGTVALPPTCAAPRDAAACAERARALGERIVALYATGKPDQAGTEGVRTLFRAVQWRLARLADQRAEVAGHTEWNAAASAEQLLADRLRKLNSAYQAMDRAFGRVAESSGAILTPREGLKLGLDRADFKLATRFAETIIVAEPDDPEANFAFGMNHFLAGEHARAEPYLKKCLVRRPDDPAVLNNLAVVELRLSHLDEAEKYACAALERLPNSNQIKRTLTAIRKARGEQQEESK